MELIPNTFNIEARCSKLVEPTTEEELMAMLPELQDAFSSGKLLVIGRGSNLLPTKDFDGIVLRSRIMGKGIVPGDDPIVECMSGECMDSLVEWAVANGLYGLENLSGIPGDVGAAAVQNIGAYGVEIKDFVKNVEYIDLTTGKLCSKNGDELEYSYRHSMFKNFRNRFFITKVTLCLSKDFVPHIEYGNICKVLEEKGISVPTAMQIREVVTEIRNAKLPDYHVEGNAGSFFMNPIVERSVFESILADYPSMPHYFVDNEHEKIPAGWMIEQCGWKGRTVGKAGVHDKQALVLVNKGGASGQEVLDLCQMVQNDVLKKFGIEIKPEVNIV